MSVAYQAVGWNRQKKRYDLTLGAGLALYLALFLGIGFALHPRATAETMLIRAFGTAAFLLLHVILSIGPLCRLDRRFLPLLYNRRHLGVTMFLVALAHGVFSILQFHGFGDLHPLVSVLTSNGRWDSLTHFPFQPLGLLALVILFLMAATSHDFWLANLSAPVWKALHMLVYLAYGLLVLHVALGVLQAETHPAYAVALAVGVAWVLGLHLVASRRETAADRPPRRAAAADGFVDCGAVDTIPDSRARVVSLSGERVAIFRYGDRVSAISNVCKHQNGPLGEGKIVDGCVVCPWHGYQYRPEDGASPPPFTEKVPTFAVRVEDGRVLVHPQPLPPGTAVPPARVASGPGGADHEELYTGYLPMAPPGIGRHVRRWVTAMLVVTAGLAVALAAAQRPFAEAVFEYGVLREFVGVVRTRPVPMLEVARPGAAGDQATSRYLLVAPFKHGADALVHGLDGQRVRLRGSLVYRGGRTLIEALPGSLEPDDGVSPPAVPEARGGHTMVGEIVDSKCYLGVMKPGEGKPHRACAVRCISGGIPPLFVVHNPPRGLPGRFLLVAPGGKALGPALLDRIAEPVEISGEVTRLGDLWFLEAEPAQVWLLR